MVFGPPRPWNALAITSFVLAFFVPVAAIVCGHIALSQIKRTGEEGRGFAVAGAVIGWAYSGLIVLLFLLWLLWALVLVGIFSSAAMSAGGSANALG